MLHYNGLVKVILGLLPLTALPVHAGPCRPGKDAFCITHSDVLSSLKIDNTATAFCLNVLSISTATVESTVSVTPSASIDVVSSTFTASTVTSTFVSEDLQSSEATVTSTEVSFSTSTTTLTTSTVTYSCLDSAFTAKVVSPVQSALSQPSFPDKRSQPSSVSGPDAPAGLPDDWTPEAITAICSCLSLPTPTKTNVVTISLEPSIEVATSIVTYTPRATVTSSFVSVSTSTYTSVAVSVSVVIETEYATATTIATNGAAAYRRYFSPYDANLEDAGFTSDDFSPLNPSRPAVLSSGYLASLTFSNWPYGGTDLYLDDGAEFDASQAALLFQGFFVARQSGTYYLSTSGDYIDNYGYLWTGDVSYSTWSDSNAAFKASRTGDGYYGGSTSLSLNEGDAIPIAWLFANGGGAAQSYFVVTSPDGTSTTDTTGFLVPACSANTFA
ncbi:hypothetical protein Sste5346_008784 [Sporothrix stenoceras]|uniref:PA14 domain-containing protein n=1 Tax=Sporothrix stenoceras TaxID=5173 RepID=A0ABR3YP59_9PEZI